MISLKYYRVARGVATFYWGDESIADHILDAAFGLSYEPGDAEVLDTISPEPLPDYVRETDPERAAANLRKVAFEVADGMHDYAQNEHGGPVDPWAGWEALLRATAKEAE